MELNGTGFPGVLGGAVDVDAEDERSSSYVGSAARSLSYDSGIEYRRIHGPGVRLAMKRKRPEEETESSQCACAIMRHDFLQMAENAFKKIRRRDCSQQDFERFTTELRRTNDLLHESMELMKHIRDICDHRVTGDTWRPRW